MSELLSLMAEWNFWGSNVNLGIEREYYVDYIVKLLNSVKIVAISGIRRAGKSYVVRQVINKLIKSGVDPKDTLIIRLDDERLTNLDYNLLLKMYELYLTHVKGNADK